MARGGRRHRANRAPRPPSVPRGTLRGCSSCQLPIRRTGALRLRRRGGSSPKPSASAGMLRGWPLKHDLYENERPDGACRRGDLSIEEPTAVLYHDLDGHAAVVLLGGAQRLVLAVAHRLE